MSPRPPMPIGTYGNIACAQVAPSRYKARARFRDRDGIVRTVSRFGQTKTAARHALREALAERIELTGGDLRAASKVADLAAEWLAEIEASDRSTSTKEQYGWAVARMVLPQFGEVRLREASTALVDQMLGRIRAERGPGAAKTARAVLNGMFGLAVRHDAIPANPVRETRPIAGKRGVVRALTEREQDDITDRLRSSERAVLLDLPDLVDFMLATGCRIGEAMAVREGTNRDGEPLLDLDAGTVEINATVIRIKGKGLIVQDRPKTAAGWRRLALPPFAVTMIRGRAEQLRLRAPERVVFPSPYKRALRDPSNTAADLRECLDASGYEWVTSHVFRKTVATRLDVAGWSARQIADQLGHAAPSMTQDVYMGRRVVGSDAARILDR